MPPIPQLNPNMMQQAGMANPFATPPPNAMLPPSKIDPLTGLPVPASTPPPSPSLGFSLWSQDPLNSMKVQPSMTDPGKLLQPGASQQPQMASSNPPPLAPMASSAPPQSPAQAQLGADQALQQQYQKGSGASQVKNPWLRGLAIGGDIAGSMLLGRGMAAIPGSTARNIWLQNQQQGRVAQDQSALKDASEMAYQQAQTQNLLNPRDRFQPLQTPAGYVAFDQGSGTANPVLDASGQPVAAPTKPEDVTVEHQYGQAVYDAIRRGVDPSKDPRVVQLQAALQGKTAVKEPTSDIATYTRDYIAAHGLEDTPANRLVAHQAFTKETKVEPGVERAQVYLQMPTAVADPNNPGGVIYATRAGAIGQQAPQGIATQVPLNVAKVATSGPVGQQLLAIGTARQHMQTFDKLADALGNSDWQGANKIGTMFGTQFGSDKATNLQIASQAFAGEVGRAFDGAGVTQGEREQAQKAYAPYLSKGQFKGAIKIVDELLAGKQKAAQAWVDAGMQGQPYMSNPTGSTNAGDPLGVR